MKILNSDTSQSDDENNMPKPKSVRFDPNKKIKPPTIMKSNEAYFDDDDDYDDATLINPDNFSNGVDKIGKLETLEQVRKENALLLQELNNLEKKKRDGYDVSTKYKKLKKKFQLLKEIKQIIVETEMMKTNEDVIKGSNQFILSINL